jgi:hypothetical protein
MQELVQSKKFIQYQVKLIDMMAKHIMAMADQNDFAGMKSARDLSIKVIKFPESFFPTTEEAIQQTIKNLRQFRTKFITDAFAGVDEEE